MKIDKIYGTDSMMRLQSEITLALWDEACSNTDEEFTNHWTKRIILQANFDNFALICEKVVISV